MIATVMIIRMMMNATSSQWRTRIRSAICNPIPPAPTTPRMVAERVLLSKKYSAWASITGATCGRMPKRMAARRPPPAATTPSACFFSAFSMASA